MLLAERAELEERVAEAVTAADTPREEVRAFLSTLFAEVRSNPLISTLIVDGELRELQDRITAVEEDGEPIAPHAHESDLPYAERWAEIESIRYDDPELIDGLFVALLFTARARNAPIGTDSDAAAERVEDALIETIVDGLFVD
ncbi:hypothetical protein [Halorubrum saccharovorum]|uniref:hypothetical protein n=1 Tax=Halorubrum saccharovorum TaxID=2248 RepID=UPI00269A8C89|nr:hypothetical protein [Halorubrum saccharovorum]